MKKPSVNDVAPTEATSSATSDVDNGAVPAVPIFSLDLPRLPSVELALQEQRFIFEGIESFLPKERTLAEDQGAVRAALRRFDERETFDDAPLEAFRELGLAALRPSRYEDLPYWQPKLGSPRATDELLHDLRYLRGLVWNGVERWQDLALTHASLDGRRQARIRLREFGRLLIPETRGRRQDVGPPATQLQLGYRQLLFRLQLARQLADEPVPPGQAPSTTLEGISQGCGLPEEWVRGWLFFSDRWERKSRPQSVNRRALELLAEIAREDPDSIATLISRARRSRSRKKTKA